ncbi:MAG: glycosyltransferase family 1 protein, partial [Patescibacteria group bacterium]
LLGIPVLSSDHECMTEVLSESGALYCDAKDIEKFAQAMKKIAEDDELRGSLITNGQVNAKKYSWKKMAQQTLNIYKRK